MEGIVQPWITRRAQLRRSASSKAKAKTLSAASWMSTPRTIFPYRTGSASSGASDTRTSTTGVPVATSVDKLTEPMRNPTRPPTPREPRTSSPASAASAARAASRPAGEAPGRDLQAGMSASHVLQCLGERPVGPTVGRFPARPRYRRAQHPVDGVDEPQRHFAQGRLPGAPTGRGPALCRAVHTDGHMVLHGQNLLGRRGAAVLFQCRLRRDDRGGAEWPPMGPTSPRYFTEVREAT